MACVIDVRLLPCCRGHGLHLPRLDASDMGLAPLDGVARGHRIVLDIRGKLAHRRGPLRVLEVGSEFERVRSNNQAGDKILVVPCLGLLQVAIISHRVLLREVCAHYSGSAPVSLISILYRSRSSCRMRLSASRAAWSSSRKHTAVSYARATSRVCAWSHHDD